MPMAYGYVHFQFPLQIVNCTRGQLTIKQSQTGFNLCNHNIKKSMVKNMILDGLLHSPISYKLIHRFLL